MGIKKPVRTAIYGIISTLLIVGAVWYLQIVNYESSLGTNNVVNIDNNEAGYSNNTDDVLSVLSFKGEAENLSWSSLEITLKDQEQEYACTFGSQSSDNGQTGKMHSTLGADAKTFTTVIDATSEDEFTLIDISNQVESNESSSWLKFSKTDLFFAEDVSWKFLPNIEFASVETVNVSELSNDTDDRIEWYEYDFSVHRVIPNDGVFVLEKNDSLYKIKIISYYNSDDDSRYPTMLVSALNGTEFPALQNPNLVVPSPCKIIVDDQQPNYWNSNETIILKENGINICAETCDLVLKIKYETIEVKVNYL